MTSPLPVTALDYDLPPERVATRPAEPRDTARLLVLHRTDGRVEHRTVRDLPEYLAAGDRLVFNDTAVAPARLSGQRTDSGGRIEGLFLEAGDAPGEFVAMLRSNGRLRPGLRVCFAGDGPGAPAAEAELVARADVAWRLRWCADHGALDAVGHVPLPPYILRARRERGESEEDARDAAWYATVFADPARRASVAAPTAGLHFTPDLLTRLDAQGVVRLTTTLDVGPGTFRPIESPTVQAHPMHVEHMRVPEATLWALRSASGGRTVAVGTTTVRTLESLPDPLPTREWAAATDLLIAPGHDFRLVEAMMTNFHLPRSTLLALVGAFAGLERVLAAYAEAVRLEYRFYSYGDAMLIV